MASLLVVATVAASAAVAAPVTPVPSASAKAPTPTSVADLTERGNSTSPTSDPSTRSTSLSATSASGFTPVVPARLVDTRPGASTIDGRQAAGGEVPASTSFLVDVAGRGGVPSRGVRSVMVNVTAVRPAAGGYLTVFPGDQTLPISSNVNFRPGAIVAGQALVGVDANGQIAVFASANTHLVVDVVGWVATEDADAGSTLTPARITDSRAGQDTIDGRFAGFGALDAGRSLAIDVTGRGGVPSTGVGAVIVSLTAVHPMGSGFLTVFPAGQPRPNASSLNVTSGAVVANQVVAKLDSNGRFTVYTSVRTDVIVDVLAWVPVGSDLTAIVPGRLLDTRPGATTADGQFAAVGHLRAGEFVDLQVGGRLAVPLRDAGSVFVNVTSVAPSAAGYLTVYPKQDDVPHTSSLNFKPGQVVANQVFVQLGRGGIIRLYSSVDTDVIVDLLAWLPPGVNQPSINTVSLSPDGQDFPILTGGPGTGAATFALPAGSDLGAGDAVALLVGGEPYYGKVTDVTNGIVVTTEGNLGTVIPQGSFTAIADESGYVLPSESTGVTQSQSQVYKAAARAESVSVTYGPVTCEVPTSEGRLISVNLQSSANVLRFDAGASWSFSDGFTGHLIYKPSISFSGQVDIDIQGSCSIEKELGKKDFPEIKFSIGVIPVVIRHAASITIEGSLEIDAKVGVTFGASFSAAVGVRYDDGFHMVNDVTTTRNFSAHGYANFVAKLGLSFGYEAKLYGVAGLEMAMTPYVALHIETASEKWLSLGAGIDTSVEAVIGIEIGPIDFSKSWTLGEFELLPEQEIFSISRSNKVGLDSSEVPLKWAVGAPYEATLATDLTFTDGSTTWETKTLPEAGFTTEATADQKLLVTGTPTTVGRKVLDASATVLAADDDPDPSHFPRNGTKSWTIEVGPQLAAQTVTVPTAEVEAPYQAGMQLISGGVGPFTVDDSQLPAGLYVAQTTTPTGLYAIVGSPEQSGDFTANLVVSDAIGSPPVTVPVSFHIVPKTGLTDEPFPVVPNGGAYSHTLTITNGLPPFSVRMSGQPAGITYQLVGRQLTISGTTTVVGTAPLRVDISSNTGRTTATRYMTVLAPIVMPYRTTTMPLVGQPLLRNDGWMEITGGQGPFNWTLVSGPSGITLDTSQHGRRIRPGGTTPAAGTNVIMVSVTDAIGSAPLLATVELISINAQRYATLSLREGAQGAPYSAEVEVGGGVTPFTWRVVGLPPGLTVGGDATSRLRTITGTPTSFGTFNVEITATDTSNRPGLTKVFTMVIAPPFQGTLSTPAGGIVDEGYTNANPWSVHGGKAPYTWTYSGLPPGLSLGGEGDGSTRPIIGTPTTAGTYAVTLSVTDSVGSPALTGSWNMVVADPLAISTVTVPTFASTGTDFSTTLSATGGFTPYSWAPVSGLPAGLTLSTSGAITGRITQSSSIRQTVTVQLTDRYGHEKTATFQLWLVDAVGIDTSAIPNAVRTGLGFSGHIAPTGGKAPFTYSSTLPAGLGWIQFNAATGVFSATRSAQQTDGPVTFTVTATDTFGQTVTVTKTVSVQQTPALAMSLAGATTRVIWPAPVNYTPTATGGNGPYTWTISGQDPVHGPTLSIDAATGAFTATPFSSGTFTVTVTVTDASTPAQSVSHDLTIEFATQLILDVRSMASTGKVGVAYSSTPIATAGAGVRHFTATGLPNGLTISPLTGAITGKPLVSGTFNVRITGSDDITTVADYIDNGSGTDVLRTGPAPLTLVVAAADPIVINTGSLPAAVMAGQRVTATMSATGGVSPYTWTASGVPSGIVWDSTMHTFDGVPTASDIYNIAITATDSLGAVKSINFTMDVQLDALEMTVDDLWTVGHHGVNESLGFVRAKGGAGGYVYSVTGTMPPGLSLNTATGEITGSATQTGTWSPTITVTDSGASVVTTTWNIEVKEPISISTTSVMRDYSSSAFIPITVAGFTGNQADLVFTYGGGVIDALGFYSPHHISPGPTGNNYPLDFGLTVVCGVQDIDGALGCRINDRGGSFEPEHFRVSIFVTDGTRHGALRWEPKLADKERTSVSAGNGYTCATYQDTTARCWGVNTAGQLGHTFVAGEIPSANRPWTVTDASGVPMTGFISIVANRLAPAGEGYTCGVRRIGTFNYATGIWEGSVQTPYPDYEAWCWGYGVGGQLGNGTNNSSTVPVQVQTEFGPFISMNANAAVTMGAREACFNTGCWGAGIVSTADANSSPLGSDAFGGITPSNVAIFGFGAGGAGSNTAVGADHLCNAGYFGQSSQIGCVGDADLLGAVPNPLTSTVSRQTQVFGSADSNGYGSFYNVDLSVVEAASVTAGRAHSCALEADGSVVCWGDNSAKQLGRTDRPASNNTSFSAWTGTTFDPTWDTRLAAGGPAGTFLTIAAGGDTTCGIRQDNAALQQNSIVCWGGSYSPNAGDVTVITSDVYWDSLTVADDHACAWRSSNYGGYLSPYPEAYYDYQYGERPALICWGSNSNGQLGVDWTPLPGGPTTPHISNL